MKSIALDELAINSALESNYWRVSVVEECESTQELLLKSKTQSGRVITTEYQSAGRGRLDRRFDSPQGSGLLFSLIYQPKNTPGEIIARDNWGAFNLIAGKVVALTLSEMSGVDFSTKWPNDIVRERDNEVKKVCGMLAQVFDDQIYLGIGINVTTESDELPVPTATSLYIESGKVIDRNELLVNILQRLESEFSNFTAGIDFREGYRQTSSTLGKNIEAVLPSGESIFGKAVDINIDGSLVLDGGNVIDVGDIIHLLNG